MRLIDADALAQDLDYDVEMCARALDRADLVGVERERIQLEKDCKQNCIYYLTETPIVDAVPVVRCGECVHGYRYFEAYGLDCLSCRKLVDKNGNGIEFPVLPDGYCSDGKRKSDMSLGTDNSPHMELEPITGEYNRYHGELDVRNGTLTIYGSDRCVCCGAVVPEGSQVCPTCIRKAES